MNNYVIIGNSAAGIAAVEAIRQNDRKGRLTVISDEPYLNYSRPLISYLLGRKVTPAAMSYRRKDFYKDNGVNLILNKRAVKLELKKKEVSLADKRVIHFDKLLMAAGGTPIIPDIKGSNLAGVFTLTRLEDAEKIEKYIIANKVKKAIIIGGGLIGLKATEALMDLKIEVTIVELADRILSGTFDRKASAIIESALKKMGGRLISRNTVVEIKGREKRVKEVVLKDKKRIPADLLIMAIGVRPNITLAKGTPIKTNKGILVNSFMQTSVSDIYAAGDCCESKNLLSGLNQPMAIWPAAVRQGRIAGLNMAGIREEYPGGLAMNAVELCGIPTISVGETCPEGEGYKVLEYSEPGKSIYKKIVIRENRIVGAIFVGAIERAGIYTGLIKDRVNIATFKEHLLKEDFGLISLPKDYRKHLVTEEMAII